MDVNGYRCRSKSEYEAALRDEKKINKIKENLNVNDYNSVEKVYRNLINNKYDFETPLGSEIFDDYIYELYTSLGKNKSNTKSKSVKKQPQKKKSKSDIIKNNEGRYIDKEIIPDDIESMKEFEEYESKYDNPEFKKLVEKELKKKELTRHWVLIVLGIVAVGSIIYFSIYSYYAHKADLLQQQANSAKKESGAPVIKIPTEVEVQADEEYVYVEPTVLEKYEDVYNSNKSLIGWIQIADTNIDYPVMQTVNNEYYLNHNFNQESDRNGCIFLDYNCSIYPRSTNLIIYGHHMKSGKMFGTLNNFESEEFCANHPYIMFDTIYEEGVYQVCYVFRDRVRTNDDVGFKYYEFYNAYSKEEFDSYMSEMKEASLYDTGCEPEFGDVLITLSTCDYVQNNGRFVVVAKRVEL